MLEINEKIKRLIKYGIGIVILSIINYFSEVNKVPVTSTLLGCIWGLFIPKIIEAYEDFYDKTKWETSLRQLERGKFITEETPIRISFAYLFRIKVGKQYFLVRNGRGTGKLQPVGGVYKFTEAERTELKNNFHIMDDDKIPVDESSRNDYRLRLQAKELRNFMKHFNASSNSRENISDLSRELKEELIDTGLVNWRQIDYRVCGRHMTEVKFGEHFQIYELLLADIIELQLTPDQEDDLKNLAKQKSEMYGFCNEDEIKHLGVNTKEGYLQETIADHTVKILQETEPKLMSIPEQNKKISVRIKQ